MKSTRILALSGSLRKASHNTALITAIGMLAAEGVDIRVFTSIGELPLFNPDREDEDISVVKDFKDEIASADGLFIASPEYAHGISAVMKNALDWLVSGAEFMDMPVALLNASPRAKHAQLALREVITTMSGKIMESASISLPLLSSNLDAEGIANHPQMSKKIIFAMKSFVSEIENASYS